MASTVCWTLSPTAIGVKRSGGTWWTLASRMSRLSRRGSRDPDPFVRGQIATALGFMGGPEAIAALKNTSGESDPDVAKRISFAQLRLTRPKVVPLAP